MPKGEFLGEFEQLVLLALMRLGDDAYGMRVRQEIKGRTGRDVSIGAIYTTLNRLEEKKLITSELGEATEARGGRAKRMFTITADGERALERAHQSIGRMLEGLNAALKPS